jgi:hypothetical protein
MARFLSFFDKMRGWLLALIGVVIGVQPTIASVKKPELAIPERLAAVRSRMHDLQSSSALDENGAEKKDISAMGQWGNGWLNWNNWNNWGNWSAWNNWGNFGNWLNS